MFGYRADGKKVKDLDPITKIVPHIMKARYDAQNLAAYDVRCEPLDAYIRAQAEQGVRYTYMHILIAAVVRIFAMFPGVNRFVMNGRIYQHNDIQASFVVKKSLDINAPESLVKITCTGRETLNEIREKIDEAIAENAREDANNGTEKLARLITYTPNFMIKFVIWIIKFMDRHGMFPMSILNLSPFHTSFFLTNLKSIKGPVIYHHLYDFGTTGLFLAMGKDAAEPTIRGGEVGKERIMPLHITMDERFCDGFYWITGLKQLQLFLLNPSVLEKPFDPAAKDQSGNL